jgi:hypothetical protein
MPYTAHGIQVPGGFEPNTRSTAVDDCEYIRDLPDGSRLHLSIGPEGAPHPRFYVTHVKGVALLDDMSTSHWDLIEIFVNRIAA